MGRPINFVFGMRRMALCRMRSMRSMCAVRSTAGVRQARCASAECIMLYVLTVYPVVSWAPRGRAHEFPRLLSMITGKIQDYQNSFVSI